LVFSLTEKLKCEQSLKNTLERLAQIQRPKNRRLKMNSKRRPKRGLTAIVINRTKKKGRPNQKNRKPWFIEHNKLKKKRGFWYNKKKAQKKAKLQEREKSQKIILSRLSLKWVGLKWVHKGVVLRKKKADFLGSIPDKRSFYRIKRAAERTFDSSQEGRELIKFNTGKFPRKEMPQSRSDIDRVIFKYKKRKTFPINLPRFGRRAKRVRLCKNMMRVHVSSSKNNTVLNYTNLKGLIQCWSSGGNAGFHGARRKTKYAAQQIGSVLAKKVHTRGFSKNVWVDIDGFGQGRETSIKGLKIGGIKIHRIRDQTGLPHNGCRLSKKRRH